MTEAVTDGWLTVTPGELPLLVSLPHTGTALPALVEDGLASPWLGRKDTDWHLDRLYGPVIPEGATVIRTSVSRTAIDVNRDPSGVSLYPGQATTELCPLSTFDGEPLYRSGRAPHAMHVEDRRATWWQPYHEALAAEITRLRRRHRVIVLWDAHSIRSQIPRLFDGVLPHLNLGTNGGTSCDATLTGLLEHEMRTSGLTHVTNGRFRGGYITRHYGCPADGVHAVQLEMACRTYLHEPVGPVSPADWPPPFDDTFAAHARGRLAGMFAACLTFARQRA